MKHFFVDTNIIIDLLADRKPFSNSASDLFELSIQKKIKLYISAISFNNIYYILRQQISHKQSIKKLSEIGELTSIIELNKNIIEDSLQSAFHDFEEAIQYHSALSSEKIQAIVTRDLKGYKHSEIPVISSLEAVKMVLAQK